MILESVWEKLAKIQLRVKCQPFPEGCFNTRKQEFPSGSGGWGSSVVIAMAQVTAMAWVQSPAWELPHAAGAGAANKQTKSNQVFVLNLGWDCRKDGPLEYFYGVLRLQD